MKYIFKTRYYVIYIDFIKDVSNNIDLSAYAFKISLNASNVTSGT